MNEQVKKNIMEYKQKYLQKLTDAQVPEKLEKQLEEMDWSCLELIHRKKQQRGTFAPLQAAELSEIRKKEDLYRETGLKALREGKVGAILLAGGQGTRLGFDKAKDIRTRGIEWLNVFAVDNVLQRIADPVFVGATILSGCVCGSKVVRKVSPYERVGAMCLEDGKPSIVEYYELTPEMAEAVNENGSLLYGFGVILNYLFRVDKLMEIVKTNLPMHIVEKKVPYLDENGQLQKPKEPNAYKFETLILDMVYMMDNCLPFEVEREKEFAPVKNALGTDSVESARELLKKNGIAI